MAYTVITKVIGKATVEFQKIDGLLLDKVNQLLDSLIKRNVPISMIRERMLKYEYPSIIVGGVNEEVASEPTVKPAKETEEKKPRKKSRGELAGQVCTLYAKMESEGATTKQMYDAAQKQFDGMSYGSAYAYYKAYEKGKK
jgi:hypothetical protein